jgi:transposase-like protein
VKRQRHTPEQVIRKLRIAEQMLSEGKTAGEAAKALEVSEQTLHRWRNQLSMIIQKCRSMVTEKCRSASRSERVAVAPL